MIMNKFIMTLASAALVLSACQTTPKEDYSWVKKS